MTTISFADLREARDQLLLFYLTIQWTRVRKCMRTPPCVFRNEKLNYLILLATFPNLDLVVFYWGIQRSASEEYTSKWSSLLVVKFKPYRVKVPTFWHGQLNLPCSLSDVKTCYKALREVYYSFLFFFFFEGNNKILIRVDQTTKKIHFSSSPCTWVAHYNQWHIM